MGDAKITLESMIAASDAIKALPPAPQRVRMNLTTLAYCTNAYHGRPHPETIAFSGIEIHRDNSLATGIVEVDWSDDRVETIDLLVREV